MHKRFITIVLSLVVALTACNRGQKPATPTREVSAAEYEVLTAWINAKLTGKELVGKGIAKVVIFDTTKSGDDDLLADEKRPTHPLDMRGFYSSKRGIAAPRAGSGGFRLRSQLLLTLQL
jgi:hypothetical protein